jgi:hypothetical protein
MRRRDVHAATVAAKHPGQVGMCGCPTVAIGCSRCADWFIARWLYVDREYGQVNALFLVTHYAVRMGR